MISIAALYLWTSLALSDPPDSPPRIVVPCSDILISEGTARDYVMDYIERAAIWLADAPGLLSASHYSTDILALVSKNKVKVVHEVSQTKPFVVTAQRSWTGDHFKSRVVQISISTPALKALFQATEKSPFLKTKLIMTESESSRMKAWLKELANAAAPIDLTLGRSGVSEDTIWTIATWIDRWTRALAQVVDGKEVPAANEFEIAQSFWPRLKESLKAHQDRYIHTLYALGAERFTKLHRQPIARSLMEIGRIYTATELAELRTRWQLFARAGEFKVLVTNLGDMAADIVFSEQLRDDEHFRREWGVSAVQADALVASSRKHFEDLYEFLNLVISKNTFQPNPKLVLPTSNKSQLN